MNIEALQNIETFTNQQGKQKVVLDADVWNKVLDYLANLQNGQSQTSVKSALDICQQAGIRSKEDIDNSLNNEREAWTVLKPMSYQTIEFYLAASLYHAHKVSFATAASLAGMSFDTFLTQLQEQFDIGFIMTDEAIEQDLATVDKIMQTRS